MKTYRPSRSRSGQAVVFTAALIAWSSAGFVTNTTGTIGFTNFAAPPGRQFYRAQQP